MRPHGACSLGGTAAVAEYAGNVGNRVKDRKNVTSRSLQHSGMRCNGAPFRGEKGGGLVCI